MSDDGIRIWPINIRPRAAADIENHTLYLAENATPDIERRFRFAIMSAIDQIAFLPGKGAPRKMANPTLAGLRLWIVPGFRNYLLFYLTL